MSHCLQVSAPRDTPAQADRPQARARACTPRSGSSKAAGCRAGEGLPSSRRHPRYVPRPIRRGVPHGCASRLYTASMAFTLISGARHSLRPPSRAGPLTTPQASRYATDRIVAPPCGAFDAGLRPGPFPGRAASLLPGLLAATRTGLPLQATTSLRTRRSTMAYVTASPPAVLGARKIGARPRLYPHWRQMLAGRSGLRVSWYGPAPRACDMAWCN
jgi:hypothetical protein